MLSGEIFDLGGLLANDVTSVLDLSVNHVLVLDVDQRTKEGNTGSEQRHAPEWEQLDKVVRGDSCDESLR